MILVPASFAIFLACTGPSGTDTGAPPDDTPDGAWEHTLLYRPGLGNVAWEGDLGWAVGGTGQVVAIGAEWSDEGGEGLDTAYAAVALDGALWALTQEAIVRWDGVWTSEPLPDQLGAGGALLARANGSLVVLNSNTDCDDCEGPSVSNRLAEWDGADWTVIEPPLLAVWLTALAETSDGTLVAAGAGGAIAVWDGDAWSLRESGAEAHLASIAADAAGIVAVGAGGAVVRGPVDALTVESAGTEDLVSVDIGEDGTVWALGRTAAWRDDGAGWASVALPEGDWWDLAATREGAVVVGEDAGPVGLAGGASGFAEAWRQDSVDAAGVIVGADGVAWIVGSNEIARWDADGLSVWSAEVPGEVLAVGGRGPDDLLAVGYETLATWDGAAWTLASPGEGVLLRGVSVAPDGAAFAVGQRRDEEEDTTPVFMRRTDAGWIEEAAAIPTSASELIAVQAFAADDVYALSWDAPTQLLHWDGAAWTALTDDLGRSYEVLWGRDGADLYLGRGDREGDASLLRWDGTAMTEVAGAPFAVEALAGTGDTLLVSGTDGYGDDYAPVTLAYEAGVWTELFRGSSRMLVGASGGTQVVIGGGDGWRRDD
ncbi:MAG: hypothetical protein Q8P18_11470 [Pseudomonadota bacterium]|nr:hypothetical protein [Pseudomonadota bacterium]